MDDPRDKDDRLNRRWNDAARRAEAVRSFIYRSEGSLERDRQVLREQFGVKTVEEGRKAVTDLKKSHAQTGAKLERGLDALEKKHLQHLEKISG